MAIPRSPSVVVIENDVSIYTPNVESSIVGVVGFADKGPTNVPTLVTSPENLIQQFGVPNSNIPGQGLEGALEILEATNQLYYVRAVNASAANASAAVSLGFCPGIAVSSSIPLGADQTLYYAVFKNDGTLDTSSYVSVDSDSYTTLNEFLAEYFNPSVNGDRDVFAVTNGSTQYLVGRNSGSGTTLVFSSTIAENIFNPLNSSGTTTTAASSVTAKGGQAPTTGLTLQIQSVYEGSGYSLTTKRDGTVIGLSVEIDSISKNDKLTVNSDGAQREIFDIVLSPSSPLSVEFLLVDDATNNKSDYVFANVIHNGSDATIPNEFSDVLGFQATFVYDGVTHTDATPRFIKPVEGTFPLAGGNSGYSSDETGTADDYAALIGNAASKTGIYALDDDSLNISIALVPGIASQTVQNALITLAESSKNFLALVSPPYAVGLVQDAINWMNGRGARTAAINSSYAAVAWPWVQVFNSFAGADEWYDPAIFAARQCVYTDNVSEPWFAPAGFRRGRLTKPSNVEKALNQGDKDALYSNNINPITKEPQSGITIFGQKTAQREPTALDRINVRRLMIFIRKVLLQLGKPFQFEPNDQFTWELVEEALRPFLDDLIARRAIVEGDVKCDSTTNTPARVDRNELWCSVTIKPTKAAETIVFEINLTNQSATING